MIGQQRDATVPLSYSYLSISTQLFPFCEPVLLGASALGRSAHGRKERTVGIAISEQTIAHPHGTLLPTVTGIKGFAETHPHP